MVTAGNQNGYLFKSVIRPSPGLLSGDQPAVLNDGSFRAAEEACVEPQL